MANLGFGSPVVMPGFIDTFDRPDGKAVGNGWVDMATTLPNYAPAVVYNNRLGIGSATVTGSGITLSGQGQMGVYRSVGRTDNVEVTVRCQRGTTGFDGIVDDIGWQTGPAIFVNPNAPSNQMGLSLVYDISIVIGGQALIYLFAMFGNADYLNPAYYVAYDANWIDASLIRINDQGQRNQIRLRSNGGMIEGFYGGQRVVCCPVPSWAVGRDAWGANTVMAGAPVWNTGDIDAIRIRPWDHPIRPMPAATTGTPGATNKASAASSIAIAYPASVVAGQMLYLLVSTVNGAFTTPTGWASLTTATVASDIRGQIFTKTADGTETGTLTVARSSGSGNIAGVMFEVSGYNPLSHATNASSQANTTATTVAAPSRNVQGPNRLILWVGAVAANLALTVPAGYTQIANCGTSGATINMAVGYQVVSSSPAANTGTITGTVASTSPSVGIAVMILPDPR